MSEPIQSQDLDFIAHAEAFLEVPGSFIKVVNRLGSGVESLQRNLPAKATEVINAATRRALESALEVAIKTIPPADRANRHPGQMPEQLKDHLHVASSMLTGALGGLVGWAALPIELPITTALMLRSIASIAQDCGTDLSLLENRLECLYILTLGSPTQPGDATESAYFASRVGLSTMTREAAAFIARGSAREALSAAQSGVASPLLNFLARVAGRFQIAVSEKAFAEAVPIVGAVGGAALNALFTNHFNEAARFHFGLRRLERRYGAESVHAAYISAGARRGGGGDVKRPGRRAGS